MDILVLLSTLFIMIVVGVPVGFAIGGATMVAIYLCTNLDMVITAQYAFSGINSFTLLSVPFFMLAGNLMSTGGIAKRIVDIVQCFVGAITGGLGAVAVLAATFFGAISGSGMATTSAIGGMLIPEMGKQRYDIPYSTTLVCFAGTIGPIIPPSISFIMYGVVTGTSIADLFKAGIFPGLLMAFTLIVTNYYLCKKHGYGPVEKAGGPVPTVREMLAARTRMLGAALREGIWALLAPVVILGGIYSGVFTPTEAACVSVVYSFVVSKFIYKELDNKRLYKVLLDTAILNGITTFMLSYSTVFSTFLSFAKIPTAISEMLISFTDNRIVFLLLVNVILLILGCFLDTIPAIVILAPLFLPAAKSFGLNPVHFGVIMAVNLALGLCTPPYGCNLFVGAAVARIKMESMFKFIPAFITVMIICLMVIAFVPKLSLALL